MEITNDYYESLLEDPKDTQEEPIEEPVVEDEPLLPEQPSDTEAPGEEPTDEPKEVEDDLLTSPYFLTYMNRTLELYENEDRVMHISAYMWPHKGSLPDTFFSDIPNSWGWATWSRAWKYFSNDSDFLYHMFEYRWDEFNKLGGDFLQKQLVDNYKGRISTWYIKWYSMILLRNGLSLYPCTSLIGHLGMDGSGTNCSSSNSFNGDHLALNLNIEKRPLEIDKRAGKEMYAFYQGRWYNKRRRKQLLHDILNFLRLTK